MKTKQILFTRPNTAEFLDVETREMGENDVMIETVFSSISCGTEKANISGDPNISIFTDENSPVIFPRTAGYSSSGIVIAKGDSVKSVEVGDRVTMSWSTLSKIIVLPEKDVVKIEYDNISFQEAALCHIGTFPMAALRKTKLEIGESMLVMGLGILGLMAVEFAKAAGAVPVIAVDPVAQRREKAIQCGADYALDPFDENFTDRVKELTNGGANTAIEVTGLGAGLNQCLDCMAKHGRISLLGCTRNKNFTVDYYRKVHAPGIQLIGAHTLARPEIESYPGYFTQRDDLKTILSLCAMGRINLKDIVDEVHSPTECEAVYTRMMNDIDFPTVVQFDWRNIK